MKSHKQLLSNLKKKIESQVGFSITADNRRPETVFARAIYFNIGGSLVHEGKKLTITSVANYIGKHHASLVHANKNVIHHVLDDHYWYSVYVNTLAAFEQYTDKRNSINDKIVKNANQTEKLIQEINVLKTKMARFDKVESRIVKAITPLSDDQIDDVMDRFDLICRSVAS